MTVRLTASASWTELLRREFAFLRSSRFFWNWKPNFSHSSHIFSQLH